MVYCKPIMVLGNLQAIFFLNQIFKIFIETKQIFIKTKKAHSPKEKHLAGIDMYPN